MSDAGPSLEPHEYHTDTYDIVQHVELDNYHMDICDLVQHLEPLESRTDTRHSAVPGARQHHRARPQ
eukprot:2600527-Alexandrium_andersonii.AAC.1